MKTAKEWAESVVRRSDAGAILVDDEQYIYFDGDDLSPVETFDIADGIIEHLVERVQADARAPLDEEIARLRVEAQTYEGVARRVLRIAKKRVEQVKQERDAALAEVSKLRFELLDAAGAIESDRMSLAHRDGEIARLREENEVLRGIESKSAEIVEGIRVFLVSALRRPDQTLHLVRDLVAKLEEYRQ